MIFLQNTRNIITGFTFIFLLPLFGKTQSLFEETIYYKIGSDTGETADFFFIIKNGKAKTIGDISAPLGKQERNDVFTVFIAEKEPKAYVVDKDSQKIKQLTPSYDKRNPDTVAQKILIKTDKKRIIAGIKCSGYELKMETNNFFKAYVWLADDITVSRELDLNFDVMINDYIAAGKLIMAFSMISGDIQSDMIRVLQVEKKQINDTEFQIPKGYKLESVPVMAGIKSKWVFE